MISIKKFRKILDKDTALANDLKATFKHSASNWDIDARLKYQELYPQQKSPRLFNGCVLAGFSGGIAALPATTAHLLIQMPPITFGVYAMASILIAYSLNKDSDINWRSKHDQTLIALRAFAKENKNSSHAL